MMLSTLRAIPRSAQTGTRRGFATSVEPPFMWKMAHGMFDPETSMAEKIPDIPDPIEKAPPAVGSVEITTLPNGVRVASQDNGGPVAALGLFVGAGSRNETPYSAGMSHLLERLAFKGSMTRSKYRMVRDMEHTGAIFGASASREVLAYSAEGLRENVADIVGIITETAVTPVARVSEPGSIEWDIATEEIQVQTAVMREQLRDASNDAAGVVTEALHGAAFHGNTLGLPLLPEERKLGQLTPIVVDEFVNSNYTTDRLVLSAANVDHATLVESAKSTLGGLTDKGPSSMEEARYTGGSAKVSSDGPAHVAIGFKGVSWRDNDLVAACVLHTLLGGGGSFSSGGPGKGMYTRLYSEVLNKHAWVSSAMAFNHCYADIGLFGIHGSCDDPAHLNNLVEVVGVQIGRLSNALAPGELDRAKAMTKSSLVMNLESRNVVCEDIGRQLLASGSYAGPSELIAKIEAITEDDIRKVASKMLSSAPSVVTYGEDYATYEYAAIESSIKAQAQLSQ